MVSRSISARSLEACGAVEGALDLAEAGDFETAAEQLRTVTELPVERLARLYEAIHGYRHGHVSGIRAVLDAVATTSRADVFFSTLLPEPFDVASAFTVSGDGLAAFTQGGISLETIADQTIAIQLDRPLPPCASVVVHVLLNFRSNVGNSFYLKLDEEAFRFTRTEVAVCGVGMACPTTNSVPTLVTVVLAPSVVTLLVNGLIRVRKPRAAKETPRRLVFELLGDLSADLGANMEGLEVWTSANRLSDVFDADDELITLQLESALQACDTGRVYAALSPIDGIPIESLSARLPDLLDAVLQARPYRQHVLEALLSWVPAAQSEQWLNENRHRLPTRVLKVTGLVVQFATEPNRILSLGRILRRQPLHWFNVLDDINFDIFEGDILGIIGENGAGKSTLLRTLCGLIPIKQGEIFVQGRPVLLRSGVGFREEATGRENIIIAGSYLGVDPSKMSALTDEIIDFAELREAIDRPFKFYSDGMKTRLMFSLATTISPEILFLDEPLNAGDTRFRDKATRRMDEIIQKARCVVMVTHGVDFVRTKCTKALYIVKGKQRYYGDPATAVNRYLNDLHLSGGSADT